MPALAVSGVRRSLPLLTFPERFFEVVCGLEVQGMAEQRDTGPPKNLTVSQAAKASGLSDSYVRELVAR